MKLLLLLPFFILGCGVSQPPSSSLPIVPVQGNPNLQISLTSSSSKKLTVSMASLPRQVKNGHPSLAAARTLISEAQGKLRSSGLRSNPELEVAFEATPRFHDFLLTVGVSRRFPRTNKLLIERRISGILVEAARAEVQDAERLAIGEAREAFVKILALRAQKSLLGDQADNARLLSDFIKNASVRGEASPLEAGVALLEASRLENRKRQVEIQEELALASLKPLLGLAPGGHLNIEGSLASPVLPPMKVSVHDRPDLKAARLRAQSAHTSTALEKARDLSDLEAGIYAGLGREEDAPNGFESEQVLGIRFKFPLGRNPATAGAVAAAQARYERIDLGAEALRKSIRAEAHAAHAEMRQWLLLAAQIKDELLPIADKQITETKASYNRGELPLQDVLRAEEQRLELETTRLEALRDFHLARIKYLTATAQ